jgi:hypothetical protein
MTFLWGDSLKCLVLRIKKYKLVESTISSTVLPAKSLFYCGSKTRSCGKIR